MAKKKASPKSPGKVQPAAKRSAPNAGPAKATSPTAASGQRPINGEEIGRTAGEVWNALQEQGEQSLTKLKKAVNSPADLVTAAVGWLAREEKLAFSTKGKTVAISLRK